MMLLIISSCSSIPAPSIITPSENRNIQKVSFGEEPKSYQNILKNYLIINLKNYKGAKVEFINQPSRLSIDHLGDTYSGYRVCLSINEKRGEHYLGYRNHFFLISNNKVDLHLYDSGLLTIPFEYCISRDVNKEYYIDDIPEKIEEISVEAMDTIELSSKDNTSYEKLKNELDKLKQENIKLKKLDKNKLESNKKIIEDLAKLDVPNKVYTKKDNIYISCSFDDNEITYIFNISEKTFNLIDELNIIPYSLSFNEAYIVASNQEIELTINRISGKAILENKMRKSGMCKLTDKTKF
jgi:hypothetical protein